MYPPVLNGLFRSIETELHSAIISNVSRTPDQFSEVTWMSTKKKGAGTTRTLLLHNQNTTTFPLSDLQTHDVKRGVELHGVTTFRAPGEAEAKCAELCRSGVAWGVIGERLAWRLLSSRRWCRRQLQAMTSAMGPCTLP